jgi:3-phosphoinositide dependent protein kinase-1
VNPDDDDDDEDEEEEDEEENGNNINYRRKFRRMPQRNKTFVGTAEYVSPEVIEDQPAGFGADLWAFGVMLYQMFCGKTPFKGGNNYTTFKNIEKLQISFPQDVAISENAKDLIKKILVKDPSKRLGAGEPNTDLDLEHLKKHPFFKGIKWKNITSQNVPNSKILKCKSNKKIIKRNKNDSAEFEMIENENKNLIVLKQGILLKKSFWFHYNERHIILDNSPKITYKDPEKDIVKGVIYLNNKCRVYATRHDIFNLDTTHRVFKFKCKQNDMISWIDAIKDCIKNYGKE